MSGAVHQHAPPQGHPPLDTGEGGAEMVFTAAEPNMNVATSSPRTSSTRRHRRGRGDGRGGESDLPVFV